jgi:hypothetical protein
VHIEILRFPVPGGTLSTVETYGFSCLGVEREWLGNKPFVSCIPEGEYSLEYDQFNKWGKRFCFIGETVAKFSGSIRTACLIHPANLPSQLAGCLALGKAPYASGDQWGVGSSGDTVKAFEAHLLEEGESHTVTIRS